MRNVISIIVFVFCIVFIYQVVKNDKIGIAFSSMDTFNAVQHQNNNKEEETSDPDELFKISCLGYKYFVLGDNNMLPDYDAASVIVYKPTIDPQKTANYGELIAYSKDGHPTIGKFVQFADELGRTTKIPSNYFFIQDNTGHAYTIEGSNILGRVEVNWRSLLKSE